MRSMFAVCFMVLAVATLSSCGGGLSGENGSEPFGSGAVTDTQATYSIVLQTLDEQCATEQQSFVAGASLCVRAALSEDGTAVSGEIITFSGALGSLSTFTKLTDSQGIAQIELTSDSSVVGASTLSASAGEASVASNYEFLASNTGLTPQASMTITMLTNGQVTNRFQADKQVQIQALVIDANEVPVAGAIVSFTAQRGTLNTDSALTDNNGVAQVTLAASDIDIGAGVASAQASIDSLALSGALNYEVQSVNAIDQQNIRLGHFDDDNVFVPNLIGVSTRDINGDVTISAGATLGLSVAIVDDKDQRILTQTPISFSSNCVADALASIDNQVNTINGVASATYEDQTCAGGSGNNDIIVASLLVNNTTVSISQDIVIQPESIGSLGFISADPTTIVLRGTGGQGTKSVSTIVFQVNGALGNPLAQQQVFFNLNTATGDLSLTPTSGFTNSQGQVSTHVNAGDVPTAVRVTARVTTDSGTEVLTQSDLLSVNTGLPDQNSMTLSADNLNPEAYDISGQDVNLVVRLADTFNNPVPDGTTVNFTTEGGVVQPSCSTTAGACSVIWTSADPRTPNHRITILATAIGHETLFDSNGNNLYDDADGPGFTDGTDSGFGTSLYGPTGFVDMSEAWRDDNENGTRDDGEIFLDFDNEGHFNDADGKFNGPQCTASNCSDDNSLHVRKALVLVMSSSAAQIDIEDNSDSVVASNYQATSPATAIARNSAQSFTLVFADTVRQPIASGSTIVISSSAGQLSGQTNFTMPSTAKNTESRATFILENDMTEITSASIEVVIISPSGVASSASMVVTLN
ncbi:MAG: hypothetical protein ACJA13_000502 [Paraglaciecola sp.]|jgi:hypothetical protein